MRWIHFYLSDTRRGHSRTHARRTHPRLKSPPTQKQTLPNPRTGLVKPPPSDPQSPAQDRAQTLDPTQDPALAPRHPAQTHWHLYGPGSSLTDAGTAVFLDSLRRWGITAMCKLARLLLARKWQQPISEISNASPLGHYCKACSSPRRWGITAMCKLARLLLARKWQQPISEIPKQRGIQHL